MNKVDRMMADSADAGAYGRQYAAYLSSLLSAVDFEALGAFAGILMKARADGRTVFLVGNGGSAAAASHMATDLMLGTHSIRMRPLRAVSLADNMAVVTALANDKEYAEIFVGQLDKLFQPGDVLVAISASGNSANVVKAVEYVNAHGGTTVGLLGFDGGRLKSLCQLAIVVATEKGEYGPVEDVHVAIDHMLMTWLKARGESGADV